MLCIAGLIFAAALLTAAADYCIDDADIDLTTVFRVLLFITACLITINTLLKIR